MRIIEIKKFVKINYDLTIMGNMDKKWSFYIRLSSHVNHRLLQMSLTR